MAIGRSYGIDDIVEDTTPTLGGNLDVWTYSIVSSSNRNITIDPHGTGTIVLAGNVVVDDVQIITSSGSGKDIDITPDNDVNITSGFLNLTTTGTVYERLNVGGYLGFNQVEDITSGEYAAIVLTEDPGGGTLPAGEYHYDFTFYTAEGDTATCSSLYGTNAIPDITVSSNAAVDITNIPTSPDPRVVGRRIYRVQTAGQAGYIARSIYDLADNTSTSWTDDGSLTPSGGINYANYNSTAGGMTVGDDLVFSASQAVTAVGFSAAPNNESYASVYIGSLCGEDVTSGYINTFIGSGAGQKTTTGNQNVFIGTNAGRSCVEGKWCCFIGSDSYSGYGAGAYEGNTYVGARAGYLGLDSSWNDGNTCIGDQAGKYMPGVGNTCIGWNAGFQASPGGTYLGYNIFIGMNTGRVANGADFCVLVGYDLDPTTPAAQYEVNVGTLFFGNYASGSEYAAFRFDKPYYFGAGNDASLQYDGTDFKITTDHVAASDLVIDCGTEKTLELVEPVTADIPFSLTGARVPASNAPAWAAYSTNTNRYTFAVNDYIDFGDAEINHDWKEGDTIEMHLHWITNGANDGTARKCNWIAYYTMGDMEEAMDAEASLTAEDDIPALEADRTHHYLDLGDITMTGKRIGCTMNIRLKRIACTGTEPANDPFVAMVGVHYGRNTLGSRQEGTK